MTINSTQALKFIIYGSYVYLFAAFYFKPTGFSILKLILSAMIVAMGCLLIIFFLKKKSSINEFGLSKYLYLCLLLWCVITILRVDSLNLANIISLLGLDFLLWAWLVPLAAIFGSRLETWLDILNGVKRCVFFGAVVGCLSILLSDDKLSMTPWLMLIPYLLFTSAFFSRRDRWLILVAALLALAASVLIEQRSNALFILIAMGFYCIELLRYSRANVFLKIILCFVLISTILVAIVNKDVVSSGVENNEHLLTDSRTFLFEELYDDFSTTELVFGRGVMGTYFSNYFHELVQRDVEGGDAADRISTEVGYLQMTLKGGVLMVILHVLIMMPAAYLGIIKGRNSIVRMCGYIVLIYFLLFSINYYQQFTAHLLLLWVAIGSCLSKKCRNKTDEELFHYQRKFIN